MSIIMSSWRNEIVDDVNPARPYIDMCIQYYQIS